MGELRREILLGYLSGALDENETQKVRQELQWNETLQLEFAALRREIRPLTVYAQLSDQLYRPPKGLAKKACRRIWDEADGRRQTADGGHTDSPIHAKRKHPGIYEESCRNPKRGGWKLAEVAPTLSVGILVLLLLIPAFQFVKNQIVQSVRQKTMRRIADNTAAMSKIHEDYFFYNELGNWGNSIVATLSGNDLGSFLSSCGEPNLSRGTLNFLQDREFSVSPQSSASTLVGHFPIHSNPSPQYIQSFPQVSSLFDPRVVVSSQSPEKTPGISFAEWDGISTPVFAEVGGGTPVGTLLDLSKEQNLIFRDGRLFFRKHGLRP